MTAEKLAREYAEPREWAEDHYEHWEDIDPVEAAEDGYRAGCAHVRNEMRWRTILEEKPEYGKAVLLSFVGGHICFGHLEQDGAFDIWETTAGNFHDAKIDRWQPITLPATKEGAE